jgi:hypothetical protein
MRMRHLSMDHLSASVELAVFRDCAMCLCPAKEFASFASAPRPERSVQDLGELYFGSVLDLVLYIRAERNSGSQPTIAALEKKLAESVEAHSVHCFPALFAGNSFAHVGLIRLAARKLGLSDVLASLSPADATRVQRLFVEGVEVDSQIKHTPLISTNAFVGFDLSAVHLCVPELHCLGQCLELFRMLKSFVALQR